MKIVVADDHPILVDGIQALLATEGDFEVVARCVDGAEALDAVRETRPDILLLDLNMPKTNGLAVLGELASADPRPGVVLLAAELSGSEALEAVRLGVRGIVLKAEAPRRLIDCLRAVARGERWIDPSTFQGLLETALSRESLAQSTRDRLTNRELDIARLAATGLPNKKIATRLGISEGTVKTHLYNTFQKLDVRNRTQLAALVREHGLA